MQKLRQIKKLDAMIDAKLEQLSKLKELMTKVNVSDYHSDKVQTTHNNDQLCDTIAKIIDLERIINQDIDRFVDLKEECMKQVDSLEDPKLISIAYKRYFEYKTFEQIAEEMELSTFWVIQLNKKLMSIVYRS